MNHSMKRRYLAAVLLLGAVINTPAMALGFLDDMIYSVKCAAAEQPPNIGASLSDSWTILSLPDKHYEQHDHHQAANNVTIHFV